MKWRWTRHSKILLGAGAIYVGIGVSFFFTPAIYKNAPSLKIALDLLTFDEWAWIYIAVGVVAMGSGLIYTKRPFGYMVMAALSSAWSAFYVMAVIFEKAPKLTLVSGLLFGLLAFVWIQVSGFVSPESIVKTVEERRGYPS